MLLKTSFLLQSISCYYLLSSSIGYNLTSEEYEIFEGKDFCKIKDLSTLKKLCKAIAQLNEIVEYDETTLVPNESCTATNIPLPTKNGEQTPIKEDLLYCEYKTISDSSENRKQKLITTEALGKGKKMYDVTEYRVHKGKTMPINNHTDLLKKISDSYIQGKFALTLEEREYLKGKDFCIIPGTDRFQKMCVKIAALNLITGYILDPLAQKKCQNWNVSLFSMDEARDVIIADDTLYCGYNRMLDGTDGAQFETVVLGKGTEENDVMEYTEWQVDNRIIFLPYENKSNFLEEVLNFKDYETLKGEEFCTTQNVDYFEKLCKKLMNFRGITSSEIMEITWGTKCENNKISLFSAEKGDDEVISENLLICKWIYKPISLTYNYYTYRIKPPEVRALGRGIKEKDVMEYLPYKVDKSDNTNVYMPNENLADFSNNIEIWIKSTH